MPIVMCSYCEYVGQGDSMWQKWFDVSRHERKEHREQLKEDGLK